MADISRYFSNLFIRTSYRIYPFYYQILSDRSAIIPLNPGNVKHYFYKNFGMKKAAVQWLFTTYNCLYLPAGNRT